MLKTETLEGKTFQLLKKLSAEQGLSDFFLVDGTAVALYLGHRKSIDLYFFTRYDFSVDEMRAILENYDFVETYTSKNTIKGFIYGVNVYFITYKYPFAKSLTQVDGIRLASLHDIAAMKLSAIIQDGCRLKDFVDIAYMSTKLSFNEMLDAYSKKFKMRSTMIAVKALTYYDDIDSDEPIILLNGTYSWEKIQERLELIIEQPDFVFKQAPWASVILLRLLVVSLKPQVPVTK